MIDKKTINNLISFISIVAIGVATIFVFSGITPKKNETITKKEITDQIQKEIENNKNKPSAFPDYDLLKSFKSITILENTPSYVAGENDIKGMAQKKLFTKGQIQRMYLFIEASVDNGKPLSVYDDIYLTFNYKGGHILPTDSLPTPPSDISTLLYSADSLPYKQLRSTDKAYLNIIDLFNQNKNVGVDVFVSTARKGGLIKNFTVYFECKDGQSCEITK